jgi:hypothetical protein
MNATIASGETVSGAIDVYPGRLYGFVLPAAFTGTAITFQVSEDGSTYRALYDDGNTAVSITVTQARAYAFKVDDFHCLHQWRYIKLVSGSAEGADRTIQLLVR